MLNIIVIILRVLIALLFCLPALYYFVFAVAGRISAASRRAAVAGKAYGKRFCVLIPAYMSDAYIMPTVREAVSQDYPRDLYRVLVISDRMTQESVRAIRQAGAEVLEVSLQKSTKAASLSAAMRYLGEDAGDYVVILDADNIVGNDFLSSMNKVLGKRDIALQAHRCAKNVDTPVAVADGFAEEVNNLVFRQGHCALGLSSALVGSAMALPYRWFFDRADSFVTAGEDKEMELQLLRDGIYVEYASHIRVLDEKTRSVDNLQKQRLRWLSSQYVLIGNAIRRFSEVKLKAGYADKLLQWMFPPRILLFAGLPAIALVSLIAGSDAALLYLSCCVMLFCAIALGKPEDTGARELAGILRQVPSILIRTLQNLFRTGRAKDTFIHTDHK